MQFLTRLVRRGSASFTGRFSGLGADCTGTTVVIVALTLVGMIGVAGLATEAASWYLKRQTMQGATDAAAFTAATAKAAGATSAQFTAEADSIAGSYHFVAGNAGATVSVNNPPASGNYTNNSSAVEVIIRQRQRPLLSTLFLSTGSMIEARSVALAKSGPGCILALDKGDVTDITDSGNTTLNLNDCSLYINSDDPSALTMSGGATINASAAYITGGLSTSGGAALNTTKGTHTGVAPTADPYANVAIPAYSGCRQTNFSLSNSATAELTAGASPYVFCNGVTLSGSSSLTLDPGVYIIDRGSFSMSGSATLTATGGVTIILTSSTGSNYATAGLSGQTSVSVTAPCTGSTAGLAFFQDRNAPSSGSDSFTGGSTQNIMGALYLPSQTVSYSGGSAAGGATCTQLVGFRLKFSGNSTFNNNCAAVCTTAIGSTGSQIVE